MKVVPLRPTLNIHRWFRLSTPLFGRPIVVLVAVLIIVVAAVL